MTLPALSDGQHWYAAFTQPNAEMRATMHLKNQEFLTYVPRYLKRRKSGRKVDYVKAPLFPRYIFLGADIERQRWRSINGTIGISRLICHGDRPIKIDPRVLSTIAAREDEDGLVRLAPPCAFRPGQTLRVTDGVFTDQLGLYEGLCDQDRVRILLDLLGRKVRVMIEAEMVAAA